MTKQDVLEILERMPEQFEAEQLIHQLQWLERLQWSERPSMDWPALGNEEAPVRRRARPK